VNHLTSAWVMFGIGCNLIHNMVYAYVSVMDMCLQHCNSFSSRYNTTQYSFNSKPQLTQPQLDYNTSSAATRLQ